MFINLLHARLPCNSVAIHQLRFVCERNAGAQAGYRDSGIRAIRRYSSMTAGEKAKAKSEQAEGKAKEKAKDAFKH
ncbi:hypothetical protein [Streptomyces sp. Ag109_G2-15]|uniref:hypothetical protein n=1 Tax=Streptomyces sp. Ag109_G2-15 TaxID=1938850 RepID=UPI000BC49ED4|nr:hypothetical protein [Streptomyces sp. Ag109_G2-15]SOD82148.1 hypothetical protein SAMN06272765_0481 [Streptomyces sp. Ag109_G2-15]